MIDSPLAEFNLIFLASGTVDHYYLQLSISEDVSLNALQPILIISVLTTIIKKVSQLFNSTNFYIVFIIKHYGRHSNVYFRNPKSLNDAQRNRYSINRVTLLAINDPR